ncbi:MAG: bifunctional phosphoglucose/phosphomannose isomerase [bacterium]|nr:bifunctional phosphoglucose/phosphomannose isomerase [bacterium]
MSTTEWSPSTSDPMPQWVADFPGHLRDVLTLSMQGNAPLQKFSKIVVCAMGGSAIGTDLLVDGLAGRIAYPLVVNRDPQLPVWVDRDTLVIVVSYSGNTEETLSAARIAVARGAQIAVLTSGGKLAEWASELSYLLLIVPGGMAPRAALGYLFGGLWRLLHTIGVVPNPEPELREAADKICAAEQLFNDPVKSPSFALAKQIGSNLTWLWASRRLAGVVRRWANQFSENAKAPAHFAILPEAFHNEIEGICDDPHRPRAIKMIVFRDPNDDDTVDAAINLLRESDYPPVVITRGDESIASMLYLIALGDRTSLLVAQTNQVDPTPIPAITKLKSRNTK